ncbi:hypothetical protein EVAR_69849_1 [Eumeta japonica]|uniref:Dynactin subunit 3 n=1 Tax=Eumeta variegata TaxID=151549 RepID=A0A4C1TRQ9_EUMVA|nr:hypothetical protein EVAR_69849_1 [Eumeta japonica]
MEALDILEKRIDTLTRIVGHAPDQNSSIGGGNDSTKITEENQHVRAKEVYVNAVGHELHTQFQQLDKIKELEPTLGAEYFRNIPGECVEKLKQICQDNGELAQQAEFIEESLILAMKRYGEIQTDLLTSLNTMNKRLETVEEKLHQKKKEDMDKEINTE